MIKKMASSLAHYFAGKDLYPVEKTNVYSYGFELLLSTFANALGILLLSFILGVVPGAILFSVAFISIRVTAGGYHAKHHWSCFLTVIVVFLFFALVSKYISAALVLPYIAFSAVTALVLILIFSPVEADNKPLGKEQKKKLRTQSLILVGVNTALAVVFMLVPQLPIRYLAFYLSGGLAASISLVVAKITKK